MKSTLFTLAIGLAAVLFQAGCASSVYVTDAPPSGAVVYTSSAAVPAVAWVGPGYYGGVYYRSSSAYYNSTYYRNYRGGRGAAYSTPWGYGGHYETARGGSATWHNGSGEAEGWRGGSANWDRGSGGSAEGWRGGSASWGGGSASWETARGRSGSASRRR